jgi:hypothetical protein
MYFWSWRIGIQLNIFDFIMDIFVTVFILFLQNELEKGSDEI